MGSSNKDDYVKKEDYLKLLNLVKTTLYCKVCNKIPTSFKYVLTKCNHLFCDDCSRKVLESEAKVKKCLICNTEIPKGSLAKVNLKQE